LARYQKTASDKGKFIDMVFDNFNSFLFVVGLAYAQIVNLMFLIPYVYLMLLSKAFRVYINSLEFKSDWYFRAVAGFTPNLINYASYVLFLIFVIVNPFKIILNYFFVLGSLVLFIDSIRYFFKILNKRV
jgi:phosphatidylglycerophosphate synthase